MSLRALWDNAVEVNCYHLLYDLDKVCEQLK